MSGLFMLIVGFSLIRADAYRWYLRYSLLSPIGYYSTHTASIEEKQA
jgi:hypothetical protein